MMLRRATISACLFLGATSGSVLYASDTLALKKQPTWKWTEGNSRKSQFDDWISKTLQGEPLRESMLKSSQLASLRGIALLESSIELAGSCQPSIGEFAELLKSPWTIEALPSLEASLSSLIANGAIPEWIKPDIQLIFCRALVHHELYDEASQRLATLAPDSVSDASTWYFCMAVCQHHLLQKTPCEETLDKLLERETEIPTRYAVTARLMQADIKPLKSDSLDEVARMMNDVERRLALGRAGKQVRDQEQLIIDKLEKMIDQIEKQMQQQQQQKKNNSKNQSQPNQSNQPMDQSQAAGGKGDGEVDDKDIGNKSGWGNLPPAERQEALQSMTKDLPSHYREVIEAYFKRLATSQTRP